MDKIETNEEECQKSGPDVNVGWNWGWRRVFAREEHYKPL